MKYVYCNVMILAGILLSNSAVANVKLVPKAFHGKWVGFHDGTKITQKDATKICRGSYDNDYQNRAWIWVFDSKKSSFRSVMYYEDNYIFHPKNYTKYSANTIKGTARVLFQPVGGKEEAFNDKFDFSVKDNKLYLKHISSKKKLATTIFIKCTK